MGWKGALRAVAAEARRAEREAARRQRQLEKQRNDFERMQELDQAAYEVDVFENYLDVLLSVHKDCGPPWDWKQIAIRPKPADPQRQSRREDAAKEALDRYSPSFLDRLLRRADKKRAALREAIPKARGEDDKAFEAAKKQFASDLDDWRQITAMATAVVKGDTEAYLEAVREVEVLKEIEGLGTGVRVQAGWPGVVDATLTVNGEDIVPKESKSLLKSGKLSVKQMPKGRYYEIYQDHVCGAALRVGRELLALLPVQFVVVHATTDLLNSATGHMEESPILSVALPRDTVEKMNFESLDPSDSMSNFVYRMDFKKTKGFAAVEKLDPSDFVSDKSADHATP